MATWVVSASRRVQALYGGDAARIWQTDQSARHTQSRHRAFDGIGPKKAAMAVELLVLRFDQPFTDLASNDIAVDRHVRRVFLRTGIIDSDRATDVTQAARRLAPTWPGRLNRPTWDVGRRWCHPTDPACIDCALAPACRHARPDPDVARGR